MTFKPGDTKPPGSGRKRGTVNKSTLALKEIVEQALGKTLPEKLLEIAESDPESAAQIYLNLMAYSYPRLAAQTVQVGGELNGNVTDSKTTSEVKELAKLLAEMASETKGQKDA